jgi:uncharacterized membrane protein SpoIIM required for sporulation
MRTRTALVVAGVLIMGYAAAGALADPGLKAGGVLLFLAGVLIGHDAFWMPAVLAIGAAVTRLVPRRRRPAGGRKNSERAEVSGPGPAGR